MNPLVHAVRLQAAAVAALLVAGGVRVGTYEAPLPTRTPAAIWAAALARSTAGVDVVSAIWVSGSPAMSATGFGSVDLAAKRSFLRLDYDPQGERLGFVTSDELVDGPAMYVRRPGGHWFSSARVIPGGARPYDPVAAIGTLPRLTRLRDEPLRNDRTERTVITTHYTGAATGSLRTVDVWVDPDGLPVRVVAVYAGPPRTQATITVDLFEFRDQPPIAVPTDAVRLPDLEAVYDAVAKS